MRESVKAVIAFSFAWLIAAQASASSGSFEPVYFAAGSARVQADAQVYLRWLARWIAENAEKITIECHAFEEGGNAEELALSRRRAEAVRDELVKLGVPVEMLSTVARGSEEPTVLGSGEEAARFNRYCGYSGQLRR